MKNRLSQFGILIILLALISATALFYLSGSDNTGEFLKTDLFRIIIMPIICCGLVLIATGEYKQNLKVRFSIKILFSLLLIIWIVLTVLIIQQQF